MDFIILALAVWRLSSLLVNEHGPFDVFDAIRAWLGVRYNEAGIGYAHNPIGGAFACLWCMSVWAGLAVAVLYYFYPAPIIWGAYPFALSALAIGLDRWANG